MTLRRFLAWLSALLAVTFVVALGPRLDSIGAVALGLGLAMIVSAACAGVTRTPLDVPLAACAVAVLLADWRSPLQDSTPAAWLTWLVVIAGIARAAAAPRAAHTIVASLVALGTTLLAYVALVAVVTPALGRSRVFPLATHWGMYPEMGVIACLVLPLAAALPTLAGPATSRRMAAIVLLGGGAAGLLVSFARAAWIAVAAGLLTALAAGRLRLASIAKLAAGLALLGLLVMPLAARHFGEGAVLQGRVAVTSRVRAWESARVLWSERTLTGWGPGTWRTAFRRRFGPSEAPASYHSHNMALQAGTETGLAGLLAATWLLLQACAATLDRIRAAGTRTAVAFDAGLLGSLVALTVRMQGDFFDPATTMLRPLFAVAVIIGLAGRTAEEGRHALDDPADRALESSISRS